MYMKCEYMPRVYYLRIAARHAEGMLKSCDGATFNLCQTFKRLS
jgi:hypothetical protein